jgi:hypothetical protein
MARYHYSPGPSAHGPEEIDVTTIPVPEQWRVDGPASDSTPERVALTDPALDRLIDGLARRRVAGLPEDLSPYGMVALLDASWNRLQPWRREVEERLRDQGGPHRDFQHHLDELQAEWSRAWMSRYGDYLAWLTDGAITDDMVERSEAWMDEQAAQHQRIQSNPGRLSVEEIAQRTRIAILQVARDPGDLWPDEVVRDVLPIVETEATEAPLQHGVGDPQASPARVVNDMVHQYLTARQSWGWPAGQASSWAAGQVIDCHRTLAIAAMARQQGDSELAGRAERELAARSEASRVAWADPRIQPWLRGDVTWLLTARPPQTVPPELAEQARTATTAELHVWVAPADPPEQRPLDLDFVLAQEVADRTSAYHEDVLLALRGLRQQFDDAGPWWRPSTWRDRAHFRARITDQERVVHTLEELLQRTDKQLSQSLPARQAALRDWQARHDLTTGRAVAALQELQRREQGLLEERTVELPADLVDTLGPPPSDAAERQTWQAQALQIERAHASGGLYLTGELARAAASVAPPAFSGTETDREAAAAWIVARNRAGWPVSPAVRGYAVDGSLPGNPPHTSQTVSSDGTRITHPTGSPPFADRLGRGLQPRDLGEQLPQL